MDKIRCSPYSTIFWNEFRINPESCAYNVIIDQTIRGPLDVERLTRAFDSFIADHVLFDSHLYENDDGSLFWVKNAKPGKLQRFSSTAGQAHFVRHRFDLEAGPLYQIGLFDVGSDEYELVVVLHHLLIDASSARQFGQGIDVRYNRTALAKVHSAAEIAAINEQITRDSEALRHAGAERFWRELRHDLSRANLGRTPATQNGATRSVGVTFFSLDKAEFKSWRADRPMRHVIPFQIFISAWGAFVARCRNAEAVQISFPVAIEAGRDFSMGAHVNVAVLPMCAIPDSTFRQLYERNLTFFRETRSANGARFTEWPTHRIARACGAANFDIGFVQADLRDSTFQFDGCEARANQRFFDDMGAASLLLEYCEYASQFDFRVRFLREPATPDQSPGYADNFRCFLRQLLLQPDAPIGDLPLSEHPDPSASEAPGNAETPGRRETAFADDTWWTAQRKSYQPAFDIGVMAADRFDPRQNGGFAPADCLSLKFDAPATTALLTRCESHGVTLRALVQFGWHKLLQVWSDGNQTLAGAMEVEHHRGAQHTTASATRTPIVPLMLTWPRKGSIGAMLQQTQQRLTESATHPLRSLSVLQPEGEPLFHSLVVFEQGPDVQTARSSWRERVRQSGEKADYPLAIVATHLDAELALRVEYDARRFTSSDVERLMGQLENVLLALTDTNTACHEELDLLSRAERDQLLREWNPRTSPIPGYGLAARFESMVMRHPARIALADEERQYDYLSLNRRANQLAHHLRQRYRQLTGSPIDEETRIAVCMARGLDAVIAMLAVIKAGAAYVPMDIKAPAQRQRHILNDSGSRLGLTQSSLFAGLHSCAPETAWIVVDEQCAATASKENPGIYRAPHDLAHVIYTSGTTGKPKGVLIEQSGVIGLVVDSDRLCIGEQDTFLQMANLTFDAATLELWGALLNGAKLAVSTQPEQLCSDPRLFETFMQRQQVSIGLITRSLFDQMYLSCPTQFSGFRLLMVGGEALTPDVMRRFGGQTQRPEIILNVYGPTECTVVTTLYAIGNGKGSGSIPIGRAVPHRTCYVLGSRLELLPRGAIGELYVGGHGVARGYLNLPALTQERFVDDPFARETHQRMYKTGDLVRWLPDGQLEYIGRRDTQVKIRGYRIEPAEIEARLLMHAAIRQCAVTVCERDGRHGRRHELLAWYVAASPLNADELCGWVGQTLPDYMVPAHFTALDSLPLTPNGKLDTTALLALKPRTAATSIAAPRTPLESILHGVWCEVLEVPAIGIDEDFFRVGGDSILSILVTTKLRKHHLTCTVRTVSEQRTIARLASWLEKQHHQDARISEQGALGGRFALLPIQRWFASRQLARPQHWNQAFTLGIPPLQRADIEAIVAELNARHDMLRASFQFEDGSIVAQTYHPALAPPPLVELDAAMGQQALEHRLTELQSRFDLTRGPLWCVAWIRGDPTGEPAGESTGEPQRLFVAAHHLVIDTVSWRIIQQDVKTLCESGTLGDKGSSYRQWVDAVTRYAQRHASQLAWWQAQLAGQADYRQRPDLVGQSQVVSFELDARQTDRLLKKTSGAFRTGIDDLLLSALAIALQRWHGQAESWLTLEGHGREDIDRDLDVSRTVGWFTCMYPVKLAVKENLAATLRHVKECLRAIPDKGIGYGALNYASTGAAHAGAFDAQRLPAIGFNYLGQFSSSEAAGLWQIAAHGCGAQVAACNNAHLLIDINGGIFGQRLQLSLNSRLRADVADRLARDFIHALNEIIDLCASHTAQQRSLFTPSDFPHATITLAELDRLQHRHAIENVYRATHTQRELMYFNRIDPDYQIDQIVMEMDGPVDARHMTMAWAHVVAQHDILRAGFTDRDGAGDPHLFICKQVALPIQFEDWRGFDAQTQRHALNRAILQQRNEPFDFESPPLFRLFFASVQSERHSLIFTFNHILFDGWSLGIVMTELSAAYAALRQGRQPAAFARSFMPFAVYLQRDCERRRAQAFWDTYLQGAPRNQRLPNDTTPAVDRCRQLRMRNVPAALPRPLNDALYAFGKLHGYTANQLTQLAWMRALAERLDEDDIAIGTTMSERPAQIDDVARLVGLFVASPVLRLTAIRRRSAIDLLDDIRRTQADRQQFAFHELNHYDAQWVPHAPFGSLFVFENMPEPEFGDEPPFRMKTLDAISGSNHQTVLCLVPHADGLQLRLFYDARELSEDTATRLLARFTAILDDMVTAPVDSAPVRGTRARSDEI